MSVIAGSNNSQNIFTGQRKDFIVLRKDTFEYVGEYTYVDSNGITVDYDFTGCVGQMQIKKRKNDTQVVRRVNIIFDDTTLNQYTLRVEADEMDMDAGKYYYDLQIYDADGDMVTKLYGTFKVLQDVTDFDEVWEEDYDIILKNELKQKLSDSLAMAITFNNKIAFVIFDNADFAGIFQSRILEDGKFPVQDGIGEGDGQLDDDGGSTRTDKKRAYEIVFSTNLSAIIMYLGDYGTQFKSKITYTII